MSQMLADIARMAPPASPPATPGVNEPPAPKPPSYVNASDIKVDFPRPYLAEAADVEQYVGELRKTLMDQIQQGKKVIV